MPDVAPNLSPSLAVRLGSGLVTAGVGVALFTGLAWTLRPIHFGVPVENERARESAPHYSVQSAVEIAEMVRALQLVTVELRGTTTAELHDESWRGEATARVTAPVRYLYGVDLAEVGCDHVKVGTALGTLVLTLPPPRRLAVEVDMTAPVEVVDVRGFRLRSRIGEYLLGQARVAVHRQARVTELSAALRADLLEQTRTRIAELVPLLLGESRAVEVRFAAPITGREPADGFEPPLEAFPVRQPPDLRG